MSNYFLTDLLKKTSLELSVVAWEWYSVSSNEELFHRDFNPLTLW